MEIPSVIFEKPKRLFSIEMWLVIMTFTLWLDAFSRIDPSFSLLKLSLESGVKFVVSSGIIIALLHRFCLLVHFPMVFIVFMPKLNLDKIFFNEPRYCNSDRFVFRDDLFQFAIEKNNDAAMQVFKDFMKSENNREFIAKMSAYFFFFLNINFFSGGVAKVIMTSLTGFEHDLILVKVIMVVLPTMFLYYNFKWHSLGRTIFVEVSPGIKKLIASSKQEYHKIQGTISSKY